MADHLRFTQDLVRLRAEQPALRSDNVHPYYVSDADRVLAFHRWLPTGQDVIVVATLAEQTWWSYDLGFPLPGFWREVFNSDVYDNWVNPWGRREWRRRPGRGAADARVRGLGVSCDSGQCDRPVRA